MPPFIPKRRLNETPPPLSTPPAKKVRLSNPSKPSATHKPAKAVSKLSEPSSDSDSSLSDVDSEAFEDVPAAVKHFEQNEEDSDEDVDWEDAGPKEHDAPINKPLASGDIELTFSKTNDYVDYGAGSSKTARKGPSRREKEVRTRAHQMHVQFLLYHNLVRNSWACDSEVQKILVGQLPSQIKKEVDKWRRASGLTQPEKESQSTPKSGSKGRRAEQKNDRNEKDWGNPSTKLEPGKADMSRGDPLILLLKVLSAYWKKKFAITAPGLRKRGYGTKLELRKDIDSHKKGDLNVEIHGEVIHDIEQFRTLARDCEGSRDVGAQLFTALLRGLGIESRLVASLQPCGYGFTKAEQMAPRKTVTGVQKEKPDPSEDKAEASVSKSKSSSNDAMTTSKKTPSTRKAKGKTNEPINLDSDAADDPDDSDASIIDVTPFQPKARPQRYDRELAFPIYWTEAISPVTSKPIPVSPLVLANNPVASADEHLVGFEPRGAKADAARLVMAYVIGYSGDNTAKDLTVRYLRKHIFPGKAKPFRFPVQSIPIYSSSGRIKRWQNYDWFQTVLSPYIRPHNLRTATDDLEDSADLVPRQPEKKAEDGVDTLSSLKSNPDFVLERHLRREEALRPSAKPDRMFLSGKEPNIKSEPVYRRTDVERCLTAESWHKEGRRPKVGETPMKLVPVRAVTLTRKREAEEHERVTGEKQMQGIYSANQTEYIIPPPIRNGVIPKNSYGNIDAFVPSMVPKGGVHIPLKGTVRICKKLEIDFAEAVVGFEFGNKRAVPVVRGVVVASENEKVVRDAWMEYDEAQRKKEETKMERLVLDLWRRFVMGLRIREEVGETYGSRVDNNEGLPEDAKTGKTKEEPIDVDDESMAGGFGPDANIGDASDEGFGGSFLLPEEGIQEPEDLVMEDHRETGEITNPDAQEEMDVDDDAVRMPMQSRKGKGKEDQYPTPVSIPPPRSRGSARAAGRAPRGLSLLQQVDSAADGGHNQISSLWDSLADSDTDSGAHSNDEDMQEPLAASPSSLSSASDSDPDSEPSYFPASPSRRRSHRRTHPSQAPATATPNYSVSLRTTRASTTKPIPSPTTSQRAPTSDTKIPAPAKKPSTPTPTPKPTQRRRHRPRNVLTSPYFDGSTDD